MSASLNSSINQTPNPPHKRIKKLPPLLVNQLAAGEVVTRPASVVKELIENALDAGAKNIEIRITQGGMGSIEVRDDGEGIHPDDMVMAVTRFATSKVADVAHLQGIATLGFRGEALAATAAVSRLTLISSADQSGIGRELNVAGILEDTPELVPVVHPQGTTVVVRDLYFNVPARRGNLKSISTEYAHIEMVVKQLALMASDVSVSLWHNDKRRFQLDAIEVNLNDAHLNDESVSYGIFQTDAVQTDTVETESKQATDDNRQQHSLSVSQAADIHSRPNNTALMQAIMARLMAVLPASHDQASVLHPDNLQPIVLNLEGLLDTQSTWQSSPASDFNRLDQGFMGVTGFLIPSDKPLTTAAYKLIYINGRLVKDRRIAQCVRECANQIEGLQSLGYVLFFNLPTAWLNLNVHPSKQCVKVQNLANVVAHLQVGVNAGLQRWQAQYRQQQQAIKGQHTSPQHVEENLLALQSQRHLEQRQPEQRQSEQQPLHQRQSASHHQYFVSSSHSSVSGLGAERSVSTSISEPLNSYDVAYEAGYKSDYEVADNSHGLHGLQHPNTLPEHKQRIGAQCLYVGAVDVSQDIDQTAEASHILIQLANTLFVFNEQGLLSLMWQLGIFDTLLGMSEHQLSGLDGLDSQLGELDSQETDFDSQFESGFEQIRMRYQQADNSNKRQLVNQWLQCLSQTQNYSHYQNPNSNPQPNSNQNLTADGLSAFTKHALCEMSINQLVALMLTTDHNQSSK